MDENIRLITTPTTRTELKQIAEEQFGDMVKAVVDIEKGVMAVGGEMHADEEALLLGEHSSQKNLWGINLYPDNFDDQFIEYDSMINIRPSQGNRSRTVEDEEIKIKIQKIISALVV